MFARTVALCSAGLVAGIILVLACGDDSPSEADAAPTCDCPEAEPPLAGRIVFEEHGVALAATAGAQCDLVDGAFPLVLSGGCRVVDDAVRASGDVKLVESYKKSENTEDGLMDTWMCTYDNATGDLVDVMITLTCLVPAPASN